MSLKNKLAQLKKYIKKHLVVRLVDDWRQGYKWVSTWSFLLITFIATNPIPNEVLNLIDDEHRTKVIGVLALIGVIMRFIKQTRHQHD